MITTIRNLWIRYWLPSKPLWRKLGDSAILCIPVLEAAQFSNPIWQDRRTIVYIALVAFKFLTNFSKSQPDENKS